MWTYDAATERLEVIYDVALTPDAALRGVDNIVVSRSSDLYVAEDGGDLQICTITPDRVVAPFLEFEATTAPRSPARRSAPEATSCTSAPSAARTTACSAA